MDPQYNTELETLKTHLLECATLYDPETCKIFFLLPNLTVQAKFEQARTSGHVPSHVVGVFDSPTTLTETMKREWERDTSMIMVIRAISTVKEPIYFCDPLILNATMRIMILGEYLPDRKRMQVYFSDRSKFGTAMLNSVRHPNILIKDVGFAASNNDLQARTRAAALGGAASIALGTGAKVTPWLAAKYVGSWGIKATTGGTGFALIGASYGGYKLYTWATNALTPAGEKGSLESEPTPLSLPNVLVNKGQRVQAHQSAKEPLPVSAHGRQGSPPRDKAGT